MISVPASSALTRSQTFPRASGAVCAEPYDRITKTVSLQDHRFDTSSLPATIIQVERGCEIIAQGEWASYCFEVLSGCARIFQQLNHGRRHVAEFVLPGEIYGLEMQSKHEFAAQAVCDSEIRLVWLNDVEKIINMDHIVAGRLRLHLADKLRSTRARLVVLGQKTASERIAGFLLEMSERIDSTGFDGMTPPMGQLDIAEHLGLTLETVGLTIKELRRRNIIMIDRAAIRILDAEALFEAEFPPS